MTTGVELDTLEAEVETGTTAAVCAAAGAALPMPKILTEDLGILATRDTVGAGTRFVSVGAADSVTAGAATADDDATG